jgi:hypothetical protein
MLSSVDAGDRLALIGGQQSQDVQAGDWCDRLPVSISIASTADENEMLNVMNATLNKIRASTLAAEINLWLQARTLARTNPVAQLECKLADNRTDRWARESNLLFERGVSSAATQNYDATLADFEAALPQALVAGRRLSNR